MAKREPAECPPDDIAAQSWPSALHGVAFEVHRLLRPLRRTGRLSVPKRGSEVLFPLIERVEPILADLRAVAAAQDARSRERAAR